MKPAAAELAGYRVPIEALERRSEIAFRGYAEWTQGTRAERERCSAQLVAKLSAGRGRGRTVRNLLRTGDALAAGGAAP